MRRRTAIVGAVCLVTLCLVVTYAAMRDKAKFSTLAENEARDRKGKIQAEIKELGEHPWAGEYYEGDGLGVGISLSLAPKSGFVFEWHGCMGVYDRNYGGASFADNRVRLSFTFPNNREGFQGISPEFIPVCWGPRRYLIPPKKMIEFCNSVNADDEPRHDIHGLHLIRWGDEKKPVHGWPTVPAEFERYLLKNPIATEIVAVGTPKLRPSVADWKFKDTPVTLKGGTDIGLRPGMEMHVTTPEPVFESILVGAVKDHTAEGLMTGIGEESVGPKVGWKLSTQPSRALIAPNRGAADKGRPMKR